MKKTAIVIASLFTAAAPAAFAQYGDRYQGRYQERQQERYYPERYQQRYDERDGRRDFARVIESRPVNNGHYGAGRHECWNPRAGVFEEVRDENRTRVGKGAAIGAVAGGVLGHQVDQGGGTAAGALLGGILGHQLERRNDRNTQDDLDFGRCRTLADAGATQYEVRYQHEGREYVTLMPHNPGRTIRIGIDTRPDGTPLESVSAYDRTFSGG